MATISSIGVGSGLPLDTLLNDLRKAENLPLVLIAQRQELAQSRLSSYGLIKNSLDELFTLADKLSKPDALIAMDVHSSHEGLSAHINQHAIAGNYTIEVQQTARAQELVAQGYAELHAPLTDAETTLSVHLKNGEQAEITIQAGTTLNELVAQINANADLGIDATVINDGTDSPYRLMLRRQETGVDAAIQSIQFSDERLNNLFGYDAAQEHSNYTVTPAADAAIVINGIPITSASNKFSNVIRGVDLSLEAHHHYEHPIELKIAHDVDKSKDQIIKLVEQYNELFSTIDDLSRYDIDSNTKRPLAADSTTRRIKGQLTKALQFHLPEGNLHTLNNIGISLDPKTGRLLINEQALTKALQEDLNGVNELISGPNGFAAHLVQEITPILKGQGDHKGFIDVATDSVNKQIRELQKQYDTTQDRIDARMNNYRMQFQQLDLLVNQMNQTSSYLTQQLSMLANMNKQGK